MSLRAEDTGFHTDIRQGQPWLQTRWWFAPSQPNRRWRASRLGRVRALIGRRMSKQARHAGTHEGCESPHASDDARLDLSDHGQAARLSSEGADHRSRPHRAVRLRPQLNSGSRFHTKADFISP